MPAPINKNRKLLIYDRETMLVWIDKRLAKKAAAAEQRHLATTPVIGLDNTMASAFLRAKKSKG